MPEPDPREGQVWEAGWQGHAEAQRARLARLALREKLRWLEEAQHLLHHLGKGPAPRSDGTRSAPPGR